MSAAERKITRADIIDLADYAKDRRDFKKRITEIKRDRRVSVGPFATFYFENYDTMWHQIMEMLHIERGGEAQIKDELDAYNPLIPQGNDLFATVMFEIEDAHRRAAILATLGNVDNKMYISVGGVKSNGIPDPTRENTDADGKASSVQFMRFPFTAEQIATFRTPGAQVLVGIEHPHYGHIAVLPENVRAALAADFA